jgi:hypothetical protein
MNDLFDLPPERELPDSVRHEARLRILAEIQPPARTLGWVPIAAAAAVFLLVLGAVTVGVLGANHIKYASPASGGTSVDSFQDLGSDGAMRQLVPIPAERLYNVMDHKAPPEQAVRCVAAGAAGWQPLFTASARGVVDIVYQTSGGPRFCELTPSTVTLSAPVTASAPGTMKATFVSQSGTVAGVLDPSFGTMQLGPGDRDTGRGLVVVQNGIFVAPNNLPPGAKGLDVVLGGSPEVQGGQRFVPANALPAPAPSTVDRPQLPGDPKSDGGRRLTECFNRSDTLRAVDPANWKPTESVPLGNDESIQLGRYGDLLAVCVFTGNQVRLQLDEGADSNGLRELEAASNPYLYSTTVFYDFRQRSGGGSASDTVAVNGLVKSAAVTSVSISRPESPDVVATVHNGTFVLPGINLNEGPLDSHDKSVITAYGATGAVLDRVPIHI